MTKFNRRVVLKTMGSVGMSLTLPLSVTQAKNLRQPNKEVRLGVIADLHGGLAVDADERLQAFLNHMGRVSCDGLVQLGDFAFPNAEHQLFADKFNSAHSNTIHVIGNHEFDFGLTREDCYQAWDITSSYYSQDIGEIRVLVLDGNESGSPNHQGGYPSFIGSVQKAWLQSQLEQSSKPTLILSHQPLAGTSSIDNATEIQNLLSRFSDKILLCLNGHSHVDNYQQVKNVGYLHINSASYYWVGGKTRMAYYRSPLFTVLTIDPATSTIQIEAKTTDWKSKSPKALGYFKEPNRPPENIVTPQIRPHHISKNDLRVMTWNIWGRLNEDPKYSLAGKTARQRTYDIIRESNADIIAMIETYGSAAELAAELGFHHHTSDTDANLCIFSRYPLSNISLLNGLNPFSFLAATVTLPGGQNIRVYDIWLTSGGRHIVGIKDPNLSDDEFSRGDDLRYDHLKQLLDHPTFQSDLANADKTPLILAGDFNCVSHLDHNPKTKQLGINHQRNLDIKVSKAMQQLGFTDTYRATHPEITPQTLGHTWTTVGPDYKYKEGEGFVPAGDSPEPKFRDPYARIDYIYCKGSALKPVRSSVLTHHPTESKAMFPAFPSDHAAVITNFAIGKKTQP